MKTKSEPITDYKGVLHASAIEMCKAHNLSIRTYYSRLRKGWSGEKLMSPARVLAPILCDHQGNTFDSEKDMCNYYLISQVTFRNRIKAGLSLEEALHAPFAVVDHEGTQFRSISLMCNYWGIEPSTYNERKRRGIPTKEALTVKRFSSKHTKKNRQTVFKDHLGETFETLNEMCEHWNVSPSTYHIRRKKGLSIEKALTISNLSGKPKIHVDHLGNEFPTARAMCKKWNISVNSFASRIKKGMSLEEALTLPIRSSHRRCVTSSLEQSGSGVVGYTDHLGNVFPTRQAMCDHWDIPLNVFSKRISKRFSLEDALTKPNI